ncbi:MAG: Multidrug resistance protein MdtH [Phycisphaerales bacterium]|nr:Multidrug resistance protein MdtH [Phycisphaerales bacterium]
MVYPLLPMLVVGSLGASVTVLGVIEGLAESVPALTKVLAGHVSDRVGRRKPLAVAGYACSTFGKLLLAIATAPLAVFAGRVTDRFGKGIRGAPRDALIADATPASHRGHAFGFHRMMDTAGAALGVLAAFFILTSATGGGEGPLRSVLWLSLVPAALAVGVLAFVREAPAVQRPRQAQPGQRTPWRMLPGRLKLFLIITFVFALAGSTNQFLLLRAQQVLSSGGLSQTQAAAQVCLLYLLYNLVYAAGSYPFGRLSDRIGRKRVLVAGYALYAAVYAGFAVNTAPWACWLLFGIYGLFPALTDGVEKALVSDLAPSELRATLLGLHGTLQGVGLFPASVIGGLLWDQVSPQAAFWVPAALGVAAALGLALLPTLRPRPSVP